MNFYKLVSGGYGLVHWACDTGEVFPDENTAIKCARGNIKYRAVAVAVLLVATIALVLMFSWLTGVSVGASRLLAIVFVSAVVLWVAVPRLALPFGPLAQYRRDKAELDKRTEGGQDRITAEADMVLNRELERLMMTGR